MAVQVLAGSVISHSRARVRVAGGDLDVPEVDVGIEHGRDPLWRSMCGCALVTWMPAVPASRRRRRVAARRSIRLLRLFSRIARARSAIARPVARRDTVEGLNRQCSASTGCTTPGAVAGRPAGPSQLGAPGEVAAQVGFSVLAGGALEAGMIWDHAGRSLSLTLVCRPAVNAETSWSGHAMAAARVTLVRPPRRPLPGRLEFPAGGGGAEDVSSSYLGPAGTQLRSRRG